MRDGGGGAGEQAPEAARLGGALPQHAEDDGAEERRDEEAEQRLDVVHDAGGVARPGRPMPMETSMPMTVDQRPMAT